MRAIRRIVRSCAISDSRRAILTDFHCEAPEAAYESVALTIHDGRHRITSLPEFPKPQTGRRLPYAGHPSFQHDCGNRDRPIGTLLYTISCMHCMTTSLAQGGMGLGAMWGEEKALEFFDGPLYQR